MCVKDSECHNVCKSTFAVAAGKHCGQLILRGICLMEPRKHVAFPGDANKK